MPTGPSSPNQAPNTAAMALPPRKRSHGEKACPSTGRAPWRPAASSSFPHEAASVVGTADSANSNTTPRVPQRQPPARHRFTAPGISVPKAPDIGVKKSPPHPDRQRTGTEEEPCRIPGHQHPPRFAPSQACHAGTPLPTPRVPCTQQNAGSGSGRRAALGSPPEGTARQTPGYPGGAIPPPCRH